MKDQLKTIREALEEAHDESLDENHFECRQILKAQITALAQLESMAGEPEFVLPETPFQEVAPGIEVGYDFFGGVDIRLGGEFVYVHINYDHRYTHNSARAHLADQIVGLLTGKDAAPLAQQYEAGDMASAAAQGFRDGVASVARQAQTRPDFTDEWTGYLKDGETPFERFLRERKDLQSMLKLYQRVLEENERLKAQQPQAEAVRWGVDWGTHGDRTCVSIIKKHADGTMEVVATEYEPERKAAPQHAEAVPRDHPLYVFATKVIHGAYRYTELPAKAKAAIDAAERNHP